MCFVLPKKIPHIYSKKKKIKEKQFGTGLQGANSNFNLNNLQNSQRYEYLHRQLCSSPDTKNTRNLCSCVQSLACEKTLKTDHLQSPNLQLHKYVQNDVYCPISSQVLLIRYHDFTSYLVNKLLSK